MMRTLKTVQVSALNALNQGRSPGSSVRPAAVDHIHSNLRQDQLLFAKTGLNMNVTTDQALDKYGKFTSFLVTLIRAANGSISLTTAQGSLYTGAGKTGVVIMATTTPYATITGPTTGMDVVIAATGRPVITILTAASLFLALTTAQGGAATMDMYVFGTPLSEP
jgi:hypothetical protein